MVGLLTVLGKYYRINKVNLNVTLSIIDKWRRSYMNNKSYIFPLMAMGMMLGFAGCAKYKAKPLTRLHTAALSVHGEAPDNSISMSYKVFTKKECEKYLDRNVLKQGYQPVQITIYNNTNRALLFSLANIKIPYIPAETVAESVHTNTLGRVIGYGLTGAILAPLTTIGMVTGVFVPVLLPIAIIPAAFTTAAIVDGCGSAKSNDRLDQDFMRKALHDQPIMPYDNLNGLLFVSAAEFEEKELALTLIDAQDGSRFMLTTDRPQLFTGLQKEQIMNTELVL